MTCETLKYYYKVKGAKWQFLVSFMQHYPDRNNGNLAQKLC